MMMVFDERKKKILFAISVGQYFFVPMFDHLDQQVALAGEIAIYRAFDDAGPLGDFRDHRVVIALLAEDGARGQHDIGDALRPRQTVDLTARQWVGDGLRVTHRVTNPGARSAR